ncbi:phage portal protein [Phyllobacterium lublinensis]|uniref:phage portal protein n=1 Tax=Phyllobacterium lublinensis TaxID=2875708 RepID=UPI001CCCF6C7|nr:phage portal protein [Phyllobacterium sp. 2063]MBZ9653538.1 phage portal protein [Phyllobacterium sp. 2063]
MRILGLTITRQKAAATLSPVDNRAGWWGIVRESFAGAWQQNVEVKLDTVLTYSTVFRCISLISSDIAKMRMRLVQKDANGIWDEVDNPAFSPVLRKPNRFQNRIQFYTSWMEAKLIHGNTYVLKQRDMRGIVVALYVLDPLRVKPLVAEDGAVYYEMMRDDLSSQHANNVTVPASEIIHDRWNTIYHPLVGTSPIYACGLAAIQGIRIQSNSAQFFGNGSNPGGVLTAPGEIGPETAQRLKDHWDANYTGKNVGKVAVLGDGLKYEAMTMKATDSQLIEQLKWTSEVICSVFGVPAFKVGVGPAPLNNNVEALDAQYYAQCLQVHIESIELCLDEGLGLDRAKDGKTLGTEFDLDDLLRMDTATQIESLAKAVGGSIMTPNAALRKMNQPPIDGGNTVYMQQQNYSLAALNKRDESDPFAKVAAPVAAPTPQNDNAAEAAKALDEIRKGLA